MKFYKVILSVFFCVTLTTPNYARNSDKLDAQIKETMLNATHFMVEKVSTNGGYVWYYLPDFSRRWGEMEAYKTMVWLQHPGTISMGHLFLDAYHATGESYYYEAAEKAAAAIIWGQSHEGGWNYLIDFGGDRSLKNWYNTIGKNGWRLEEFQHYYGNSTFDDNTTPDAARFLLRMYLEKLSPKYKPALDKAIDFVLESQYSIGGWPQRYPLKYDFNKQGHPDYTSFYTYNDEVIWQNIRFLIQCYETLGEERLLDPIMRGMNFYLITQQPNGGWAHQYSLDLKPAGARTYEPNALVTKISCQCALQLLKFYQFTGDKRFLNPIEKTIEWLEKTKLPENLTENGKYDHPYYIEIGTGKPIYVHRKGSNVNNALYYYDYNVDNLIVHSYGKRTIPFDILKREYNRIKNLDTKEVTKDSPLLPGKFDGDSTPQKNYNLNRDSFDDVPDLDKVKEILESLDNQNRWMAKHVMISNPYIGDGKKGELTDKYSETYVGDETDTSPYRDESEQLYISTETYIENMRLLINFLNKDNKVIYKDDLNYKKFD